MNPIVNESNFQTATAAAATAAASSEKFFNLSIGQLSNVSVEAVVSDSSETGVNYSIEDAAYMENQLQCSLQAIDEHSEFPKYGWIEITEAFISACSELNLGELAQDMLFGLFEAMSAIEMMDPKMDVGMNYNRHETQPNTFKSAVEAGVLKLDDLSNKELIGIFDALFTCLVSWLEGNSMDQVLFTCLYLHAPSKIENKPLRIFCFAIRHLINIIKSIIISSSVNEEEDFQLYGNSALMGLENIPSVTAIPILLKEVEDELVRQKQNDNESDIMAVVHRLRFIRNFYQTIHQLDVLMCTSVDENNINEVYKHLNTSMELTSQIRKTIEKGTQPLPGSECPNPIGFLPRIHDRSQPPTFPRIVKIRDRPSSLVFLEELIQRLKYACKVTRMRDYYSALNFFIDFSRKSGHCILSRSVLQGLFISTRHLIFGTIQVNDFLWDSVKAFNNSPIMYAKHPLAGDRNIHIMLYNFFRYCNNTFTNFLRICGFNRARQRHKLARFIESFDSIQVEAARLDSQLTLMASEKAAYGNAVAATALQHSAQFATWVLYNCFRAMMLYLMSGFELELYAVHEYMYIYWYPYELLIGFIVSALTRTENSLLAQEKYNENQIKLQNVAGSGNIGGATPKSRPKSKSKKNKKQQKPFCQEIIYYHALLGLCGGLYKAMGALTKDGRIRQPMPKFDNEAIRFHRRFLPFANLSSPPPVGYQEFKSFRDHMMKPPSSEIYAIAAKHFDQARNALESIQNPEQEILDMLHVAKINYVVMNVLSKGHQRNLKHQPEFDFSRHRHFPIIKLN